MNFGIINFILTLLVLYVFYYSWKAISSKATLIAIIIRLIECLLLLLVSINPTLLSRESYDYRVSAEMLAFFNLIFVMISLFYLISLIFLIYAYK